jgi:hypothetical protein
VTLHLIRRRAPGSELGGAVQVSRISNDENYKFGWLQGSRKLLKEEIFWLRGPAIIPNLLVLLFSFELTRLAA